MTNLHESLKRAAVAGAASIALLAGGVVTGPAPAEAAALGRVCMVNAPDGVVENMNIGHAAFIVKDRARSNHWIYGSFGSTVNGPKAGWIRGGTWEQARATFTKVNFPGTKKQYYTRYRCINTADGDLKTAQSWYTTVRNRGYNVHTNNCLHMSMAVFKGYSRILRNDKRLPSATNKLPNSYYDKILKNGHWEVSHKLDRK
ncbi:hypothetical protein ACIOJ9_16140 [Streptomyces sp. NPDC088175]|uniref:hypothetical protein n=1 Tax=unclassified Streptomyces TaxID=2593676 RepID=UPI003812EF0B